MNDDGTESGNEVLGLLAVSCSVSLSMSQKKLKGKNRDSSPRAGYGKRYWKRGNMKGSNRMLLDKMVEATCPSSASRVNQDEGGSTRLYSKAPVDCPSTLAGGYSANWRALSKVVC